ncbi:hypothetical protein TNCV_1018621 [Trichonephila clavipes]|nr:hypothetical protein TNCV_1018621 [Trichonephila clavipes]
MPTFAMPETRVLCKSSTKYIALNAYSLQNILIDSSTINSVRTFSSSYFLSELQPPIPTSNDLPSTNDMFTRIELASSIISASSSNSNIQPTSTSTTHNLKKTNKNSG